jgi:serine/threonine protein kinase/tetratricopeptide (TPR) repeat protein
VADRCPPDSELEQFLSGAMGALEKQALESHLVRCSACQERLAQLNWSGVTLAQWPVNLEEGHESEVTPSDVLEGRTNLLTSKALPQAQDCLPSPETKPAVQSTHRTAARAGSDPANAPGTMPALPSAFGRYQVRRALGTGGFGDVYLGHDTQLDRPVAIKVLRTGPGRLQGESNPFLQEARRLARLRHPGIVTVHDVGLHDGQVYVVSDFLDGPDLGSWLEDYRPTWRESAQVVAAVANALAHLHAQLVVHRDVKPANIIMVAGAPVLVDFGLALDETQAGGNEWGTISGTPWYMSPEQAAGMAHRIDGRTDIYSLGVVFYELLTGRVPFRAAAPSELLRQVRDDEPQPPRQVVPQIPPDLERVCLKAMAKKQPDRYTTAGDFAEEIRLVLLATADQSASRPMSAATGAAESRATKLATRRADTVAPPSPRSRVREAERRQVTVLVCSSDLFESDSYLELDLEDQAQVLRSFQEACEQAVQRFDGIIVQCNEQGLLACFGYPVAYEDAAARAARTGLGLLADLKPLGKQLLQSYKFDFGWWVGIHTGPAIAEVKEDMVLVVGEARNVAVRMREMAAPGKLICTEVAHRLLKGRFQCVSLGDRHIKGISQPVQLFEVASIAEVGSAIEAAGPTGLTPLTGRDHEVSLLKDRWEQAEEGMGQVVLLVGEPGLGKSRLVYTLKEHVLGKLALGAADVPVIEWRCSPHFQNTALYPAIDFYERALDFTRMEEPEVRFDRLLKRLKDDGLARPETVPLWASLLSLPIREPFTPLSLPAVRQREETFRAMLEWLRSRAARQPVLFIIEDLHWVDASTLEFLGQFLAEGLHDRILTVLTFRPEFKTPWPAVAHQTSLALNRLTRRQAGELMRRQTGDEVPEALVAEVYDRTGGVPLFVEEFTKMVKESAPLSSVAKGGTRVEFLRPRDIPATLQDLVMARLDQMGGGGELAQLAAVLGREFDYDLVAAVASLDEPSLQAELARLVRAEILYPKGHPPRCTYIFKHALLEDAMYNSLVKGKRQQLHRRIGEVLEGQFPETAQTRPELVAHHYTEAGLNDKAVGFWLKAGQRSRERSAAREAIGHLTRGLALLGTLEESLERDERELQFLTALGPAYITAHGYATPEVGPILLRARELCQRSNDQQQLFGIMLGMWEWRLVRGDLKPCMGLAADGKALAEKLKDPGMMMEALFMPGVTMFYRAQFSSARKYYQQALSAYDDRERTKFWTVYTGHNAGVTHRCYLALVLWHLGLPDQALQVGREARELARTIGHAFTLGHAVDFMAFLCLYSRLGAELQASAEEEKSIATEQGFQLWQALSTLHQGAAMLLLGRPDQALPLLEKGYSAFRATGAEVRAPAYLGILGDAYTQSSKFEDAHKAINEALAVVEKNDDRCHEAELHRLKGALALAESADEAAAEHCFRQAVEIASRQESRAWELRATASLARLWRRQGRVSDARTALAAVYNLYTEGFATPDLLDAEALLKQLA